MVSKSRGRGEIAELTHVAPIKRGFVPNISPPITYADRLRTVLEVFHSREDQGFPGVTRLFRGIHTSQWALLDADTRLMLNVVFDGELHGYLRALAYTVPYSVALIWSNCEGWAPVAGNPKALIDFIERFQVRNNFFFAQHPELTVPDVEALLRLRDAQRTDATAQSTRQALYDASHPKTLAGRTEEMMRAYERERLVQAGIANPSEEAMQKARATSRALFHKFLGPIYLEDEVENAISETFRDPPKLTNAATHDAGIAQQIQGNVLAPYDDAQVARMYFFSFGSPTEARSWLQQQRPSITYYQDHKPGPHINLGFTYAGLEALNVDRGVLERFPRVFAQGMSQRAKSLGDRPLAAASWTNTIAKDKPVHAVLTVYADARARPELYAQLVQAGVQAQAAADAGDGEKDSDQNGMAESLYNQLTGFLDSIAAERGLLGPSCIGYQDLHLPLVPSGNPDDTYPVEYFGFRDGVSQPRMPLGQAVAGPNDEVPTFDSVLVPEGRGLLKNATFMVARQLRQDTAGFWQAMKTQAESLEATPRELAEQIVGRRMDGRRLDSTSTAFDPQRDQHAFDAEVPASSRTAPGCPFHSHARRMNPRTEGDARLNPRLMRRSIAYTNKRDGKYDRGLMFIAFNADIETQFELIQRSWLHAGNQVGLSSRDRDVLTGAADEQNPTSFYAELPDGAGKPSPLARELSFTQSFVELEWGIYLYIPAREALSSL